MSPAGSLGPEATSAPVRMCPQHPEPVPLAHPLPVLKEALEKVSDDDPGGVLGLGDEAGAPALCCEWQSFIHHVIL